MANLSVEPYVCTLDKRSLEITRTELGEDDKNRDSAIQTLRDWIQQQPWLTTPIDSTFLLRFLRCHKFSQLEARRALENYWTVRSKNPDWFKDLDPRDPKIQEILRSGILIKLPKTDKLGRTYIMQRPAALDPAHAKKIGLEHVWRALSIFREWVAMDERAQVNGLVLLGDYSGITIKHTTQIYTLDKLKIYASTLSNAFPTRVKGSHLFNMHPLVDAIASLILPLLKKKLQNRVQIHGCNLVWMYETLDMSVLPSDYLPDDYNGPNNGSLHECIDTMMDEITQPNVVQYVTSLTSSGYGVDPKLKPAVDVPSASFRKLEC